MTLPMRWGLDAGRDAFALCAEPKSPARQPLPGPGHDRSGSGRFLRKTPIYTAGQLPGAHDIHQRGDAIRRPYEMTQCSYTQEALPFDYLPERAARIQPPLRQMIEAALAFARNRFSGRR